LDFHHYKDLEVVPKEQELAMDQEQEQQKELHKDLDLTKQE
jgi:hypothetical protein